MKLMTIGGSGLCAGLLLAMPLHAETGVDYDRVRLGMVSAQSGPAATLGSGMLAGASAVFARVNEEGGIHRRRVDLLVADDGGEPEQAVDQTRAMLDEQEVFALFGYAGTPTARVVLPMLAAREVPLVGFFSGAAVLRDPVTPQVFNVRASYDDEAEAMVAHFIDSGARNVAVLYQNDGLGEAVLASAEKALAKRSMEVHAKGTFSPDALAVTSGLANMVDADPDAIVMVGKYPPLAEFIRQARKAGLESLMAVVSVESGVSPDNFIRELGEAGDGVLVTQVMPWPHDARLPVVEACRQLISEHSGASLDYVNLEGCVSAQVMVAGLQAAGRKLTRDGFILAMEAMRQVDLGGIEISYSPVDHQAMKSIYVTEIRDGKLIRLGDAIE